MRFVLLLSSVLLLATAPGAVAAETVVQGEALSLPAASGAPYADPAARDGRALGMWTTSTATGSLSGPGRLAVEARGDQCKGAPRMMVRVDGVGVLTVDVGSRTFTRYASAVEVPAGEHTVAVDYLNDVRSSRCDRNLRVDALVITTPDAPAPVPGPFAGQTLWVDPDTAARAQADAWRATRPLDADHLLEIADRPQADWIGDWSGDVRAAVDRRVGLAVAAGALPVLVAYDIPQRDCGLYSAGGADSPEAYRTWIRGFAEGIGARPAAVILEPDGLAAIDCLSAADQETRLGLLADAVAVLEAQPGVAVYLDAGNSNWIGAAEMAARLQRAGIDRAEGFALNVSNTRSTEELVPFGRDLSARVGGKHFVLDTSRNGLGPTADSEWCNPAGRALGAPPRTSGLPDALVDALLWIKRPGESDGTCNGGPSAGAFWADYALGLAQRAP